LSSRRRIAGRDAALRAELDASPKERAELAMIVDLMRNDLGRVAIAGGVRVNCTSPGSTRTQMAVDFPTAGVEFMNQPSGRESSPQEQAWPLVFLNSEAASYVNGVNLSVDGGHAAARALGLLRT